MNRAERAARAIFTAINERALDRIHDLVTDDFVDHGAPPGLVAPGPDGYITVLGFVTGVLGIRYDLHHVVADADLVAIRATGHGVHNSDHLGFPATGKPYAMPSMHLYRADGGRLAEHWGVRDELSALYQVGAITPPAPPVLDAPSEQGFVFPLRVPPSGRGGDHGSVEAYQQRINPSVTPRC